MCVCKCDSCGGILHQTQTGGRTRLGEGMRDAADAHPPPGLLVPSLFCVWERKRESKQASERFTLSAWITHSCLPVSSFLFLALVPVLFFPEHRSLYLCLLVNSLMNLPSFFFLSLFWKNYAFMNKAWADERNYVSMYSNGIDEAKCTLTCVMWNIFHVLLQVNR